MGYGDRASIGDEHVFIEKLLIQIKPHTGYYVGTELDHISNIPKNTPYPSNTAHIVSARHDSATKSKRQEITTNDNRKIHFLKYNNK